MPCAREPEPEDTIMNRRSPAWILLACCWMLHGQLARAEDIDLFVQPPQCGTGLPNVLIVLDNTANWGRNVGGQENWINERAALIVTLASLPPDRFRIGIMMFDETGGSNDNVGGGYVRAAIRDMSAADESTYNALLTSFKINGDK